MNPQTSTISMCRLIVLFLALLVSKFAIAGITPGGRGVLFGTNHAFSVTAPSGWVLDNQSAAAQGVYMAFYPQGYTWGNSPVIVYGQVGVGSAEQQVAKTVREFHDNNSPNYHAQAGTPLNLSNNKEAQVYFFEGDQWGNLEAGIYFPEKETLNFLIYSARDSENFHQYWPQFLRLAQSYENVFSQLHIISRSRFESLRTQAKKKSTLAEGEKYESDDMAALGPSLSQRIGECLDFLQGKPLQNFHLLVHIMPDGSSGDIEIFPRSAMAVCFASGLLTTKHLKHSFKPDYPLVIDMNMPQ